ncbi:Oidioi.mRNA.OKI2018_I69.chr2.g4743.t1.cds [Oikopleura dioica]|uniref:Oidioi.mRNA.OKI2018_I69.chr2.g4743.t1.cds n=1 Tax=Oikopleura dioica TaxID=34765 RepID=A0ABN7T3S7_OIKDI|nr:Oidioi.mRNA.OKI2018_I69.chr2.g4743.t1.cds [Oikopleura dioica]
MANQSTLEAEIKPLQDELLSHPIYESINSVQAVQHFMRFHVFSVWDFMSLVKRLQRDLTCTKTPWTPPKNRPAAYIINQIVLGEESDDFDTAQVSNAISHYELYLKAMVEVGTGKVTKLVSMIERGQHYEDALRSHECVFGETIPAAIYDFVRDTLRTADKGSTHKVMAAFLFGREDPIPKMFQSIIDNKILSDDKTLDCFRLYLQRHIDVDGDDHGPLAFAALSEICGDDETKWEEATAAAKNAIERRIDFWTGILEIASNTPYTRATTKVEDRLKRRVTKAALEHLADSESDSGISCAGAA